MQCKPVILITCALFSATTLLAADVESKLKKLKEMKEKGIITQSEYETSRRKVLDEFAGSDQSGPSGETELRSKVRALRNRARAVLMRNPCQPHKDTKFTDHTFAFAEPSFGAGVTTEVSYDDLSVGVPYRSRDGRVTFVPVRLLNDRWTRGHLNGADAAAFPEAKDAEEFAEVLTELVRAGRELIKAEGMAGAVQVKNEVAPGEHVEVDGQDYSTCRSIDDLCSWWCYEGAQKRQVEKLYRDGRISLVPKNGWAIRTLHRNKYVRLTPPKAYWIDED